jgi:hypothetical protein
MRAVNLIPADQRGGASRGAGRSQGAAYAVLGVIGGLALLAVLYGVARHQVSSREAKAVALEAQAQNVQASAARLAPYSSFIALREQRIQAVSQLVNSRFDWAHSFHELGRVLPAHVSISTVTGTIVGGGAKGPGAAAAAPASPASSASTAPASSGSASPASSGSAAPASSGSASPASGQGGSVASSTPAGSVPTFALTGCAKDQSIVALTLDRLRLIDGVTAVTLQSSTKGTATAGSSSTGGCPNSYPVFNVQITFDPIPTSSATSSPPTAAPVSSKTGASKSTGAAR